MQEIVVVVTYQQRHCMYLCEHYEYY